MTMGCICDSDQLYRTIGSGPFEVIARTNDSLFIRCGVCKSWIWVLDDAGKYQVWMTWTLDPVIAERAARERSLPAVLDLLLSHNSPHGLPYGPMWEPPALLDAAAELTGVKDRRALLAALEGRDLPQRWSDARAELRAECESRERKLAKRPYPFQFDERIDLSDVEVFYECASHFRLCRLNAACRLFDVSSQGVKVREIGGQAQYIGEAGDELLLGTEQEGRPMLLRIDAEGQETMQPRLRPLQLLAWKDTHFLFSSPSPSGALIEVRRRDLTLEATLEVACARYSAFPACPVRSGETWLIPNALVEGRAVTLAWWHPERGYFAATPPTAELVTEAWRSGDTVFTVTRENNRDRVDLWRVEEGGFEHISARRNIQGHCMVGNVLVLHTLEVKGSFVSTLAGLALDGSELWFMEIKDKIDVMADSTSVRATWSSRGVALDARTGHIMRELPPDVAIPGLADRTGTEYHAGRTLRLVRDLEVIREVPLDGSYEVRATLGDAAVLVREPDLFDGDDDATEQCLVVSRDGEIRGSFEAREAMWSVISTAGGPYVIEPDRLRIGQIGSQVPRSPSTVRR